MATVIDKLFKGYTIGEIEEILFKMGLKADKNEKKQTPGVIKPSSRSEKQIMAM